MSFFSEVSSDESTITLFTTHEDVEPYKAHLSSLGGTFFRDLQTRKGSKLAGWVFEAARRTAVEKFIQEHEDDERSVSSMPDIELLFDEIFRRIENLEREVKDIFDIVDSAPH